MNLRKKTNLYKFLQSEFMTNYLNNSHTIYTIINNNQYIIINKLNQHQHYNNNIMHLKAKTKINSLFHKISSSKVNNNIIQETNIINLFKMLKMIININCRKRIINQIIPCIKIIVIQYPIYHLNNKQKTIKKTIVSMNKSNN